MTDPLISVIVPIYNVAPYLRKCLDSLVNQKLKQIEVICIDDGSTDRSGEIAEEYIDPRFRIIHTENKGLSAARNRGINESNAEYIMFVDSDDWVENRFCELPYNVAKRYDADIVIFGDTVETGRKSVDNQPKIPAGLIDEQSAHKNGSSIVWNKLYKKSLFNGVLYPEGRVYEDVATTHKLIHKANRIYILGECLYHHIIRKNSISHTRSVVNKSDSFISNYERYSDLISWGIKEQINSTSMCEAVIGYLSVTYPNNSSLYQEAVSMMDTIEGIPSSLSIKQKLALAAWKINKRLFIILCRASRRF